MPDPELQEQTVLFLLAELDAEKRLAFEARRDSDPDVLEFARQANAQLEHIMQTLGPGVHRASDPVRRALFAAVAPEHREPEATPAPPAEALDQSPRDGRGVVAAALAGRGGWGFATVIGAITLVSAAAGWAWPLLQSRSIVAADNRGLRTELASAREQVAALRAGRAAAIRDAQAEGARIIADLTERKAKLEQERDTLRRELENTTRELVALQGGDHLSRLTILVLRPAVAGDEEPGQPLRGLFVWDPSKQVGLATIQNLPNLPAEQEYQVWAIDPALAQPVSLGMIPGTAAGRRPAPLRPVQRLARVSELRVTIEKKGGVARAEGPTLLISEK